MSLIGILRNIVLTLFWGWGAANAVINGNYFFAVVLLPGTGWYFGKVLGNAELVIRQHLWGT